MIPMLLIALCFQAGTGAPVAGLRYETFHGGAPAGRYDEQNFGRYKASLGVAGVFKAHDLYQAPVPTALPGLVTREHPADVMTGFVGGVLREHALAGDLLDLSDFWKKHGLADRFTPTIVRMCEVSGRPYFVPQAVQWNPIFYRKDVFAKLGLEVPNTWEEFLAVCSRLDDEGVVPITCGVRGWTPPVARWFTILNLRVNGPGFHEELMRGEVAWDDPAVFDVFDYWSEMFEYQCFGPGSAGKDYSAAAREFSSGKAAMYNLGEWLFEVYSNQDLSEKVGFFRFPPIAEGIEPAEIVHVYGAYVPARGGHREQAMAFLEHYAGEDSQRSCATTLQRLVSHSGVKGADLKRRHLDGRQFVAESGTLVPLLEFNTHPAVAQAALNGFVRFWTDRSVVDEVAASIEAAREKAYGEL